MAGFDGKAFGEEVVRAVKEHVDRRLEPVLARLDALEKAAADGMRYRGVYSRAVQYERGSTITYGGSLWFAIRSTTGSQPGAGESDWQLITKGQQQAQSSATLTGTATKLRAVGARNDD